MKQEVTATGKTVEAAVAAGAEQLGVPAASVTYEIIEAPKKGFLGFGEAPAKVRVTFVPTPETVGLAFVKTVLSDMGIDAAAELSGLPGGKREYFISIEGDGASVLIGHHGETLDALQYLTNLAANRREDDESGSYTRITVDIGNYRAKREETLRRLARRTAEKVLKYKRNITLEPMSAYERRITAVLSSHLTDREDPPAKSPRSRLLPQPPRLPVRFRRTRSKSAQDSTKPSPSTAQATATPGTRRSTKPRLSRIPTRSEYSYHPAEGQSLLPVFCPR